MKRVAIIGGGISGLSAAHFLKKDFAVTLYEKESSPGGLIRCNRVNGSLFHICGGHVFNTKKKNVLDWFWSIFDKDNDFVKADRNSVVLMDNDLVIPYPIENHMYSFDYEIQKGFIKDMLSLYCSGERPVENFEEFLHNRFGETLYQLYFRPYNEKIWRRPLNTVPMDWLEGKLPMPSVEEVLFNNINHIKEKEFVHSSFYYEKQDGSQFIADKLAQGIDIRYNTLIDQVKIDDKFSYVNGAEYDFVLFCGSIKQLPTMLGDTIPNNFISKINDLEYHGTTSVFCSIAPNDYSWVYLPSRCYDSHRIICTGNFSSSNNSPGILTGTVEFTDYISEEEIKAQLLKMPLRPQYITHHYSEMTYPIQSRNTRKWIKELKTELAHNRFYFCGRFADWEYYNMDAAIDASMGVCKCIQMA